MRVAIVVAFGLMACQAYDKATGDAPQYVFSQGVIWLWYPAAIVWAVMALIVLFKGVKA